jgi:hypothetical protein
MKTGERAIEAIVNFEDATKRGFRLTAEQIKIRRLDLIIPKNVATEVQKDALRQVRMLGIDNGVSVRIIER